MSGIDVVKLAEALGFKLFDHAEEGGPLRWYWRYEGKAELNLGESEEGLDSKLEAAKDAVVGLALTLDVLTDLPEFDLSPQVQK